ncbi:hypothetical protein MEBOL_007073 [Melittangium boletus DSM 14713]|uniref:Uncharacterized protein n=1 Tax=Melittangium boletus DSM 14713 TaxID=1294270 RepID=A0A250IP98_9BACT|nr:hypothetical protein MEBOL_007073 [Melittangium boletus DSM 14713]
MSHRTRVRNLQSRMDLNFPYQKCFDGISAWGHLAVEMQRGTGWDLVFCDEVAARTWFDIDPLDPELVLRGANSVGVSSCDCGSAIPYGLDAGGVPLTRDRQPPQFCPPCRGFNEKAYHWATFEEQLRNSSPQKWECLAPRSGFASKRDRMIYKLFVRQRQAGRRWWYFEDMIGRVDPNYPRLSINTKNADNWIQGPLELLRDIQAEDTWGNKHELIRALKLIHACI